MAANAPYFQKSQRRMGLLSRCLSLGSPTRDDGGNSRDGRSKCRKTSAGAPTPEVISTESLVRTAGLGSSGPVPSLLEEDENQRIVVSRRVRERASEASPEGCKAVLRQGERAKAERKTKSDDWENGRGTSGSVGALCYPNTESHVGWSEDRPQASAGSTLCQLLLIQHAYDYS